MFTRRSFVQAGSCAAASLVLNQIPVGAFQLFDADFDGVVAGARRVYEAASYEGASAAEIVDFYLAGEVVTIGLWVFVFSSAQGAEQAMRPLAWFADQYIESGFAIFGGSSEVDVDVPKVADQSYGRVVMASIPDLEAEFWALELLWRRENVVYFLNSVAGSDRFVPLAIEVADLTADLAFTDTPVIAPEDNSGDVVDFRTGGPFDLLPLPETIPGEFVVDPIYDITMMSSEEAIAEMEEMLEASS